MNADNAKMIGACVIALGLSILVMMAVHGCRERESVAKGGELHGFRDAVCVRPGSVIE